jgi:parvulin-like peptidyl-prolyl isomerase
MMKKSNALITMAFLASLSVNAQTNNQKDEVNGETIMKSVFEQTYYENLQFVSDKVVTKEKVMDDLINRQLGIQKAKKGKLGDEDVVRRKMEDILYHAQISKDLEPKFKQIVVTDKEVEEYYKQFPEYKTAHVLFRTRVQPQTEEWQEAQKAALEVYAELKKSPAKFPEIANKFSQSSAAPTGGDIGFQPAVRLAPEYFQAINGKPNDFITPPVRTQFGYHVIKVLAKKDYKDINTELYKKIVYDKKRDAIIEQYYKELRTGANIKINQELLK